MSFKLLGYQTTAAADLADGIRAMNGDWDERRDISAMTLVAPTGAGKTVICAKAIEELLFEDDADPDLCVLWLSDSPALINQTAKRFRKACDKLNDLGGRGDVAVIDRGFYETNHDSGLFERGRIYMLNRQLLADDALLMRRGENGGANFRDLLDAAIRDMHMVVFIDEAHRGIGRAAREETDAGATIYSSIIDGLDGHIPPHAVVGVSATPAKFEKAMRARDSRRVLRPAVVVDLKDVQKSGLIKDEMDIYTPSKERNGADIQWLDDACDAFARSDEAWAEYALNHGKDPKVTPLMIAQLPNSRGAKRDAEMMKDIGRHIVNRIGKRIDGLKYPDSFRNSFGAHTRAGDVQYIPPEDVQDDADVRVLFVREAVSAGWDCPRAEVMWSARSHSDADYMIQLAGRLTRTPLAKRAGNGDDTVDTAFCYLPFFDPELAKRAGEYLSGRTMLFDCQPATAVGRVYINPVEITWGGGHEDDWSMDDVEKAWDGIETAIIPRKSPNPLRSLVNAVTLFVNLKWDAPRVKHLFVTRLKALADEHRDEWDATLERIRTIDAKRITVDALTGETHVKQVRVAANKDVIARSAKAASRAFTPDLCMAYRKARAKELRRNDTVLFDTELAVAAACEPIRDGLRAWATDLLDGMMDSRAAERAFLPEDRKAEFDAIEGGHVSWRPLERPKPLRARHASSKYPIQQCEGSLPAWPKHVYADRRGMYHCKANDLEKLVLDTELPRERTVAWYRNPSANTARSFAVPYTVNGETKGLHPDFLFFTRMPDGSVRPSAVDPHGGHLADALPKLNGWCDWIDAHPDAFAQVLSVSDTPDDGTRMLDLTDARVRAAVRAWGEPDAVGLYAGPLSHPYA